MGVWRKDPTRRKYAPHMERRHGRPICMPEQDLDRMAARERDGTTGRSRRWVHLPDDRSNHAFVSVFSVMSLERVGKTTSVPVQEDLSFP